MGTLKYFFADAVKHKARVHQLCFIGALLQEKVNNRVFVELESRYADYFPKKSPGQLVVLEELRAGISAHGFWKQGTTAMFNIRIVNLDVGSYLHMTPEKVLAKADKEKKDFYFH